MSSTFRFGNPRHGIPMHDVSYEQMLKEMKDDGMSDEEIESARQQMEKVDPALKGLRKAHQDNS